MANSSSETRRDPKRERGITILNHEDCSVEVGGRRYLTDLMLDVPYLRMLDFDEDRNPEFKAGGQSIILRVGLELTDPFVEEVVYRNICHYREVQKWLEDPNHYLRPPNTRKDHKDSRDFRDAEKVISSLSKKGDFSKVKRLVRSYHLMGDGSDYRFREIGKKTYECAVRLNWSAPDKSGSDSDHNGKSKRDDRDQKTLGIDFRYFDDMGRYAGRDENGPLLAEIVYQMFDGINRYEDRRFTVVQWVPDIIDPERVPYEMSFEQVCDAFRGVVHCLIKLNKKMILHRDIKPDNIMMSRRGDRIVAVLGDMGMAKSQTHDQSSSHTMEGTALGTPGYMSPEMLLKGSKHATIESDIYSLGLTFHEIFSRQHQKVELADCYTRLADWSGELQRPFLRPLRAIDTAMSTRKSGKRKLRFMDELLSTMIQYEPNDRSMNLFDMADDIISISNGSKPRNARAWADEQFQGIATQLESAFDMRGTETPYLKYGAIAAGVTLGLAAAAAAGGYAVDEGFRELVNGVFRSIF